LGSVYGELGFKDVHPEIDTCLHGAYEDQTAALIVTETTDFLKNLEPDVVFAPGPSFPEGVAAMRYRNDTSAKLIVMDDSWEGVLGRGAWKIPFRRLLYGSIDGVFVPGPAHIGFHVRLGMPPSRIFMGVNAVDDRFFTPGNLDDQRDNFLFVGRLEEKKGLREFLREYRRYRREGGTWGLRLVGTGGMEEEVKEFADATEDVRFEGPLAGLPLREAYRKAGCLILPSRRDEWGLVVNEAMSCGTPVIGSMHAGAARTLLRNGVNGFMIDPMTPGRILQAMHQFSALSSGQRKKFSRAASGEIQRYGLDAFVTAARAASQVPRRPNRRLSVASAHMWKGRHPHHWRRLSSR
jgi:glycosyltransferase involved in cell wall biosynthesis